jgi:ribose transport system ATP-binding protein
MTGQPMTTDNVAEKVIEFRNLTKRFPGVVALEDVSFDVREGEFFSICGENGAGKSTLMKVLSGVQTEYEGELLIRGEKASFRGTRDAEDAGISIIHQELNLVEELSVAANIFLGRELRGAFGLLDDRAMEREASRLFELLESKIAPETLVGRLRVGDQQLVEIAKALSLQSKILIMDEPTSALTESEVARLFRVIERLRESGVTILYISHKMEEVFRLSDRIQVLRDGKTITTVNRTATNPAEITRWMVGREIESIELGADRKAGEVILRVHELSLPWPGHVRKWRLHDISFELRRGEVLGIAGLMGAGRTELLECLFGASSEPHKGKVFLKDTEVSFAHPADAKNAGVALVTEDRKRLGIFAQMDVRENVTLCRLEQATAAGFVKRDREEAMAGEMIRKLAVRTAGTSAKITSLSGGNQQKCLIGRWLLTHPEILLLDDPTRGIDVGAKAELYKLMDELCREGLGIILTSSELPELLTVCDRILVLSEGRLTAEFSRSEATEEKILEAAMA